MTNLVDSSGTFNGQNPKYGSPRGIALDPCGGNLDWSRGVESLRADIGRGGQGSGNASGALLTKVIEREIIPRLFLSHCDVMAPSKVDRIKSGVFANIDSEALTRLVLSQEPTDKIVDQIQFLLDRGITLQRIYLDLLAPIARRLGEFWEEDRCTFLEMSIALARLHAILREVGRMNTGALSPLPKSRSIYLVPVPGEQHTFGLMMVEEFFLQAGWDVASDRDASAEVILQALSKQRIDLVGFSVSAEELCDPMMALFEKVRSVSLNRDVSIIVGGAIFKDNPALVSRISGAMVAGDGLSAVEAAENIFAQTALVG